MDKEVAPPGFLNWLAEEIAARVSPHSQEETFTFLARCFIAGRESMAKEISERPRPNG